MADALMLEDPDSGLPIYVDPDTGEQRKLGMLPPTAEESGLLMAGEIPEIPSSQWVYVTHEEAQARINAFTKWAWLDQKSHGSCVGFSAAGALMWDLWAAGYPINAKLSGAYIYAWINGNRDQGASIVASLNALKQHGTCLESTVGWDTIYRRNMPSGADEEAKRFMLETGSPVSGFESIVSAGQVGKPVQFGVRAGGSFGRFDDEGVCGYAGRGSNHSVFMAPLLVKKANGKPKAPLINSWNLRFGPYGNGSCYVDERHLEGGGGGFVHGTPNYDPNAPLPPAA